MKIFHFTYFLVKFVVYRIFILVRGIKHVISLYPRVRFVGLPIIRGQVVWGNNITVNSAFLSNLYGLFQRCVFYAYDGAKIVIGDNVGLSGVSLNARERIEIGAGTLIGGNTKIADHDFHPTDSRFRNPDDSSKIGVSPVSIGAKCFIGGGVLIMKGVRIGDGCVVGAGSVVLGREYPPNSLIAGNPAKVVKILSSESISRTKISAERKNETRGA